MGKWFKKSVYGVLGVLGLGLAIMVGMTAVETALVSHSATANQSSVGFSSSVGEHSAVGDHSTPSNHGDLIINHSAGAFNSRLTVSCREPDGTPLWFAQNYSWAQAKSIRIDSSNAMAIGTECTVTEQVQGNYWDFSIFTDTDADSTIVPGNVRTFQLHAGDNFLTLSHQYDPLPRINIIVDVDFVGDLPPDGEKFLLLYICNFDTTQTAAATIPVTGNTGIITGRVPGEKCTVGISPEPDDKSNWIWSHQTLVDVEGTEDIHVPFTMDYLNPEHEHLSRLEIKVEVDAPEGITSPMGVDFICGPNDGPSGPIEWPFGSVNDSLLIPVNPDRHVSSCTVWITGGAGQRDLWDTRINGECTYQKNITIYADQTSSVTISQSYVAPYVAQCPTADS